MDSLSCLQLASLYNIITYHCHGFALYLHLEKMTMTSWPDSNFSPGGLSSRCACVGAVDLAGRSCTRRRTPLPDRCEWNTGGRVPVAPTTLPVTCCSLKEKLNTSLKVPLWVLETQGCSCSVETKDGLKDGGNCQDEGVRGARGDI